MKRRTGLLITIAFVWLHSALGTGSQAERTISITSIEHQQGNAESLYKVEAKTSEPTIYYKLACKNGAADLEVGRLYKVTEGTEDGTKRLSIWRHVERDPTITGTVCDVESAKVAADSPAAKYSTAPQFTHNRFTEDGKTFSQDGVNVTTACMSKVEDDAMGVMLCAGYVEGIADSLSDEDAICVPPEVAGKQLVEVVMQYAQKHQEMLHHPASRIVGGALKANYRCARYR